MLLFSISHIFCCKLPWPWSHRDLQDYTAVGWSSADENLLQTASVQRYLDYKIIKKDKRTDHLCPKCLEFKNKEFSLYNTQYIDELPTVLIFALAPWIDISQCLTFEVPNASKKYILKGIIYSNNHHFTARLIDENLSVWYHDGQVTRSLCQREQHLTQNEDIVPLKPLVNTKQLWHFMLKNKLYSKLCQ